MPSQDDSSQIQRMTAMLVGLSHDMLMQAQRAEWSALAETAQKRAGFLAQFAASNVSGASCADDGRGSRRDGSRERADRDVGPGLQAQHGMRSDEAGGRATQGAVAEMWAYLETLQAEMTQILSEHSQDSLLQSIALGKPQRAKARS